MRLTPKHFLKGDRVYFLTYKGERNFGTVVEDSAPNPHGYTRVQYDSPPNGFPSASCTERLFLGTNLTAEVTAKSYSVEVPDVLKLDDTHLLEDLMRLGAHHIDWSGHYGNYVFFSIDIEDEVNVLPRVLNKIEGVFHPCP